MALQVKMIEVELKLLRVTDWDRKVEVGLGLMLLDKEEPNDVAEETGAMTDSDSWKENVGSGAAFVVKILENLLGDAEGEVI